MDEVRYVQRDEDGKVVGHYANKQPGYAEERLPADHPDIAAFEARLNAPQAESDA